jgi:membrane-bound metal-dependent hydrolase YbcI (DUF457 family)
MLLKTHIIITCFFVLLVLPFVDFKIIFVVAALIGTAFPDIDTKYSKAGKKKIFRPVQLFTSHRGVFHSFSFLILLVFVLVFVFPLGIKGFVLGYGLHLVTDSLTLMGIYPFYPLKWKIRGNLRTGSIGEAGVFIIFILFSLFYFIIKYFNFL